MVVELKSYIEKLNSLLRGHDISLSDFNLRSFARNISASDDRAEVLFICSVARQGSTLLKTILGTADEIKTPVGESTYVFNVRGVLKNAMEGKIADQFNQKVEGAGQVSVDKVSHRRFMLWYARRVFPRAKFIVLVRDPRDATISALRTGFFQSRLSADRHKFVAVTRYCKGWCRNARNAIELRKTPNAVVVRYEDLVRKPVETLKRISGLYPIGIEFNLEKRLTTSNTRSLSVEEHHRKLLEDINTDSIGRYKSFENREVIRRVEKHCAEKMSILGYH